MYGMRNVAILVYQRVKTFSNKLVKMFPSGNVGDRLALVASDLVRLGEARHRDAHCIGRLGSVLSGFSWSWMV